MVLALGAMASVSPLTGLLRTFYYSLTGITVSLCTHAVVRSTRDNQLVVRSMVWIGACVGGYGVFEFLDFVDVYGHIFDQDNARYRMLTTEDFGARIVASVGHPVYLGTFLAGLLPLSLYVGLSSRCRIALLSWSPFVLIATGLILTFTRGAYAAAAVSFYFYPRRLSRLRFGPTVLVVLVLAVGAVSLDQLRTSLTGQGTIDQFKRFRTDQRGLAYTHASALIQDSPLLGVGVGDYRYLANRYGDFNDTPDNVYLRILAEWGIVGGVMTAYLVILVLRGIRTAEECLVGSEVSSLGSAVLGALTATLRKFQGQRPKNGFSWETSRCICPTTARPWTTSDGRSPLRQEMPTHITRWAGHSSSRARPIRQWVRIGVRSDWKGTSQTHTTGLDYAWRRKETLLARFRNTMRRLLCSRTISTGRLRWKD